MLVYNTLSKVKEPFIPRENKNVKLYVCGITPYDTTHLGHAFLYIFFDVVVRFLRFEGYNVTYVQNVTDIDNDILKRAKEEKKDWKALGDFWTKRFLTDLKSLNIQMPNHYVKATKSIDTIITIITLLLKKGYAYEKSGSVFFDVSRFPEYGKLSDFTREQMLLIAQERGGNPNDPQKKNPLDFILWEKSGSKEPGWKSPWSKGRPGWHIECSAMIQHYLGDQIDMHGGGRDLVFPHHESEIAQSESFTGKSPFVKYWMHAAMVMYKGEKMSKSLKNLVLVADLLQKHSANAIRYVLLSHHYRTPWEFDQSELISAEKHVLQLKETLGSITKAAVPHPSSLYCKEFSQAMHNDFNTTKALSVINKLTRKINQQNDAQSIQSLQKTLVTLTTTLGFSF